MAAPALTAAARTLFSALFKPDATLAGRAAAALGYAALRGPLPLPLSAAALLGSAEADAQASKGKEAARPEASQVAVVQRLAELMKEKEMKVGPRLRLKEMKPGHR